MADPQQWLSPETLEKYGFPGGLILGGVITAVVIFRVIKSGAFVFGDKAALAVEKAKLEIQLENALENIRERDALIRERDMKIAHLKAQLSQGPAQ